MVADWLRNRLSDDTAVAREAVGSPFPLRVSVLVFVWAFVFGTFDSSWEGWFFLAGAVSAAAGIVLFVRAIRRAEESAARSRAFNSWLLYLPEAGAPFGERVVFWLLMIGLGAIIVAVLWTWGG